LGLCAGAALPGRLFAQLSGSSERAPLAIVIDTARLSLAPGSAATLRVVIRDLAAKDHDVLLSTAVPAGWRLLSGPVKAHVPARGRTVQLVQIALGRDAAAGDYPVRYSVRAPGLDSDLVAQTIVNVRVRRSVSVS